jgi:hypothetical protein
MGRPANAQLDAPEIAEHVSNVTWYAEQMGRLT